MADDLKEARQLLSRAVDIQSRLGRSDVRNELIHRSVPVLWLGERREHPIVTIGTNPTSRYFLNDQADWQTTAQSFDQESADLLASFQEDDDRQTAVIKKYEDYFKGEDAYTRWFGRKGGAKLEGFMNGMGASFYQNEPPLVHVDAFPFPTLQFMGKIKSKEKLLCLPEVTAVLEETLHYLQPSLILLLGREHRRRFADVYGVSYDSSMNVEGFPSARFHFGTYPTLGVPVIGLDFKPSEPFLGLGSRVDNRGAHHGRYGKRESLRDIGAYIRECFLKRGEGV
ncbi:hypothetical protein [Halobacillus sp. Cin3]|uniref:hypothetical protein n=1 Tax=Halobacillus sp. Cin3 TaxID=2928441 RepID=UPI00248EAF99|nr:hypothetical protein [Halobacillus sp. Cin3]